MPRADGVRSEEESEVPEKLRRGGSAFPGHPTDQVNPNTQRSGRSRSFARIARISFSRSLRIFSIPCGVGS